MYFLARLRMRASSQKCFALKSGARQQSTSLLAKRVSGDCRKLSAISMTECHGMWYVFPKAASAHRPRAGHAPSDDAIDPITFPRPVVDLRANSIQSIAFLASSRGICIGVWQVSQAAPLSWAQGLVDITARCCDRRAARTRCSAMHTEAVPRCSTI
jgi:hypothetical protein